MSENNSIANMSFDEALKELESIVKIIDSNGETLESAIKAFERGRELQKHCEEKLKQARLKIEKITKDDQGVISSQETEL